MFECTILKSHRNDSKVLALLKNTGIFGNSKVSTEIQVLTFG